MSNWIFVDVEATQLSPANGVMTEFGAVHEESRKTFHGVLWEATPDPENPAKPLLRGDSIHHNEKKVMQDFVDWIKEVCGNDRPVFVSDNVAYDWQWINFYLDKHLGVNPFGHSGRRISDFWAGLQHNWGETQSWKRLRQTVHDHNPVNDAMGNVEAFQEIRALAKQLREQEKQNAKSGQNPGVLYYQVPQDEFEGLIEDRDFMRALEAAGVDNWEGYDIAREQINE